MKKSLLFLIFTLLLSLTSCKKEDDSWYKLYLSAVDAYSVHDFDSALFYLSGAAKAKKNDLQINFLLSKILFFQEDYEKCNLILTQLIKKHPDFTEGKIWKIRCDILLENYDLAKKELDDELIINMTDWRVFYLYSLLSKNQEKFDDQLVMLKNAELSLQDAAKVYAASAMTWGMLGMESKEADYILKAKVIGNVEEE